MNLSPSPPSSTLNTPLSSSSIIPTRQQEVSPVGHKGKLANRETRSLDTKERGRGRKGLRNQGEAAGSGLYVFRVVLGRGGR